MEAGYPASWWPQAGNAETPCRDAAVRRRRARAGLGIALAAAAALGSAAAAAEEAGTAAAQAPRPAAARPQKRSREFQIRYETGTRNLSFGVALRHLRYLTLNLSSDFPLTPLLAGLGLDDVDGLRLVATESFAYTLYQPKRGSRRRLPTIAAGLGVSGVAELDSLAQAFRLKNNGFYGAVSLGAFLLLGFGAFTVTLGAHPFGASWYYAGKRWESTGVAWHSPSLAIDLCYRLPW